MSKPPKSVRGLLARVRQTKLAEAEHEGFHQAGGRLFGPGHEGQLENVDTAQRALARQRLYLKGREITPEAVDANVLFGGALRDEEARVDPAYAEVYRRIRKPH